MASDMEKRIETDRSGRPKEEVLELCLDGCGTDGHIAGITEEFSNLQLLSMVNCNLTTLKGFPKLPNLRTLDIASNQIHDGLDALLCCPNLVTLNLGANKIKDLDALEPLKKLEQLTKLELLGCDIESMEGYRDKVFERLDNIIFLDGLDRDNEEDEEDYEDELDDEDGGSGDGSEGEDSEGDDDEDDEEDDEDGEDSEGEDEPHGVKRKHEDGEEDDDE